MRRFIPTLIGIAASALIVVAVLLPSSRRWREHHEFGFSFPSRRVDPYSVKIFTIGERYPWPTALVLLWASGAPLLLALKRYEQVRKIRLGLTAVGGLLYAWTLVNTFDWSLGAGEQRVGSVYVEKVIARGWIVLFTGIGLQWLAYYVAQNVGTENTASQSIGSVRRFIGRAIVQISYCSTIAIVAMAVFNFTRRGKFVTLLGIVYVSYLAWKHRKVVQTESAERVLIKDYRQPILLLRSFKDDKRLLSVRDQNNRKSLGEWLYNPRPFEDFLNEFFHNVGPLVAIGNPSDFIQPVGFPRKYLPHDDWQREVINLIGRSRAIIMFLGSTPGIAWELQTIFSLGALNRLVIIFPPVRKERLEKLWAAFREMACVTVPTPLPVTVSPSAVLAIFRNEEFHVILAPGDMRGRFVCHLNESHYASALGQANIV